MELRGWLGSLADPEPAFAVMRRVEERAEYLEQQSRKLRAPGGMIPFGRADFDPFAKSDALYSFLRAIRQGATPTEACAHAKEWSRQTVRQFNKNPGPVATAKYTVERWEEMAFAEIEWAMRLLAQFEKN